jgi:hypothetical protein
LPDGNLLVSVRNTWAVYEINTTTGQIVWTLGGKRNQFRRGPGTGFAWQHDARLHGSTLTVFDDADAPQHEQQSSAKELKLRFAPRTVKLIRRYTHAPPLLASAQGSARLLANGNMFVGWGTAPDFSEYNARGRQIFTGSFALGVTSYRALRFPWIGHPDAPPAIAVTTGRKGSVKVWASWNGATNVATWRVLGGGCRSALTPVARVRRTSFETRITLNHRPACVEAQALNRRGRVLGTSSAEPVAR